MSSSLVLVPGLNNTAAVFDRLLPHLSGAAQATVVDNPALETVEAIAEVLLPTLPPRFWLAGFSFGGYVALAMLEAAPQRVQGIAMICTSPAADGPAARPRREAALQAVAQGRYIEMVEAQTSAAFHPESLKDDRLMAERRAMVQAYGPQRFAAHLRATMARPDRGGLLDGRRPTLVVGGAEDALFPPSALAYAASIPGCVHATIERAGHLLPMERPDELARHLIAWMKSSESSALYATPSV